MITLGSVVLLSGILLATNQAIAKLEGPAPAHPVAAAKPPAPVHALFEGRSSGNEETVPIEVNRSGAVTLRGSVTGSIVARMLSLTWRDSMPRWAVPLLGGTVFLGLIGVWLTSSPWLRTSKGWHF